MDVSLELFKVQRNILLENDCPVDHIGKDQIQMEEVMLWIQTICGLVQDHPLPRIRHHPISAEKRCHVGNWIVLRDIGSLANTLTFQGNKKEKLGKPVCICLPWDKQSVHIAQEIFLREDNSTPHIPLVA